MKNNKEGVIDLELQGDTFVPVKKAPQAKSVPAVRRPIPPIQKFEPPPTEQALEDFFLGMASFFERAEQFKRRVGL